ncbi:aquaporin-5-like isoform X2 [Physella acuta]|uniref:aquaporin-5-like isoform X2 n=1 Tax=Physella acuta TaxID=109671 RepID=UPI0027DD79C5|nr:aquaporin-5-like isoform X2 [Physella acuta]XP_059175183.1 aquaporin-5-like isoform X2 [Physella acuta]
MEALYIHIANKLESIRFGKPKHSGKLIDIAELKTLELWRAVFAEFLAQILFVFLGCASAIAINPTNSSDPVYLVKIALAFGLAIMALVQMIGHVSGGHINPAVTVAMAVVMNISVVRAVLYVVAQVIGAILGGFLLKGLTPHIFHKNLAVTSLGNGVTPAQGFGVELILTFVLVAVIFGTTDPNRPSFGSPALLIGLTVTLGHLAGINYTGSSMNPSRSLGSAIASNSWEHHWIYWVGPIAGGIVAALVYKLVLNPYKGIINLDEALTKMKNDLPNHPEDINLKNVE